MGGTQHEETGGETRLKWSSFVLYEGEQHTGPLVVGGSRAMKSSTSLSFTGVFPPRAAPVFPSGVFTQNPSMKTLVNRPKRWSNPPSGIGDLLKRETDKEAAEI